MIEEDAGAKEKKKGENRRGIHDPNWLVWCFSLLARKLVFMRRPLEQRGGYFGFMALVCRYGLCNYYMDTILLFRFKLVKL